MRRDQFKQEKYCCAAFAIAAHLSKCGLVTTKEYRQLTTAILHRYRPLVSQWTRDMDSSFPIIKRGIPQKGGFKA